MKFISSNFLCNVVDSSLLFFVSYLTTKSKGHFILYTIIVYRVQPTIFSAKVISGWRLLKIFTEDAAPIRGV